MKRSSAALPALALILALSACSARSEPAESPQESARPSPEPTAAATASPLPAEWDGEGRPYLQTSLPGYADSTVSLFAHGEDYYEAVMYFGEDGRRTYEVIANSDEAVYAPGAGVYINCADAGEDGIWLLEDEVSEGGSESRLRLIGFSGEVLSDLPLDSIGLDGGHLSSIHCFDGGICLLGSGEAVVLDGGGPPAFRAALDSPDSYLVTGGDGQLYSVTATYNGAGIEVLSSVGEFVPAMTLEASGVRVFGGDGEFPLTCAIGEGFYGVDTGGDFTPLIIWEECRLNVMNLRSLVPLSDGRFLMLDSMGTSLLSPAGPDGLHQPVTLTIATLGDSLYGLVYEFNTSGTGYYLEEVDYSGGGSIQIRDALSRLAADIAAGNAPDLFLLNGMPVNSWIRRGYLADLAPLMESGGLSPDDITIAEALTRDGGLYFLSGGFGIDSRAALYSNRGDALGWTLEEYLEAEAALPSGSIMMYNTTRELFFETVCSRYIQKAIDWEEGSCDFDNAEFISLLEGAASIRETPESSSFSGYVSPAEALRNGSEYAVTLWIGNVTRIDEFEREVGERISLVGMPTPDGSCGSQLRLNQPVGVYAGSENPDGCLEFLKFLLLSYDIDYGSGTNSSMPVYRPYFDAQTERALNASGEDGEPPLTESGLERLEALLGAVECTTLYDATALSIIEEEAAAFFAGGRSAEEAAGIIQNRLSIYVAEQS